LMDSLINPNDCIDTYGRTYIDDLENILVENHGFDYATQKFPDKMTQEWFERVRSESKLNTMEEVIAYVRSHNLDLASIRPRVDLHCELITESIPFDKSKSERDLSERINEAQRVLSERSVETLPSNNLSADGYELYYCYDRLNPWTYLVRREVARGNLAADDSVVCIGNRWLGEILYFRQNLGLKKAIGMDLFSADPELVVVGDMHRMPFEDNSVKMIFIRQALSKSHDVRLVVNEMLRVLKKNCFVIIEIPGPYGWGVNRLRGTDVKSAKNLLRLFHGKVRRIIYQDEIPPYRAAYDEDVQRLIRVFIEIEKDGWGQASTIEKISRRRLEIYQFWRVFLLKHRIRTKHRIMRVWKLITGASQASAI
jgi:SAM-dependent methyltransferase